MVKSRDDAGNGPRDQRIVSATGVAPHTLRYWQGIGVLAPDRRVNGQRRYGPDARVGCPNEKILFSRPTPIPTARERDSASLLVPARCGLHHPGLR